MVYSFLPSITIEIANSWSILSFTGFTLSNRCVLGVSVHSLVSVFLRAIIARGTHSREEGRGKRNVIQNATWPPVVCWLVVAYRKLWLTRDTGRLLATDWLYADTLRKESLPLRTIYKNDATTAIRVSNTHSPNYSIYTPPPRVVPVIPSTLLSPTPSPHLIRFIHGVKRKTNYER